MLVVVMEALHVGGGRPRPSSHAQQQQPSSAYSSSHAAASLVSAPLVSVSSASDGGGGDNGLPEVRGGLDSNLGALCEHVQLEGWKSRAFSDIVVKAMGHTFYLHRLLLSRSSYFRSVEHFPYMSNSCLKQQKKEQHVSQAWDIMCKDAQLYICGFSNPLEIFLVFW